MKKRNICDLIKDFEFCRQHERMIEDDVVSSEAESIEGGIPQNSSDAESTEDDKPQNSSEEESTEEQLVLNSQRKIELIANIPAIIRRKIPLVIPRRRQIYSSRDLSYDTQLNRSSCSQEDQCN